MNRIMILCISVLGMVNGADLKTLIDHAQKENGQIKAKEIRISAKQKGVEAAQSAFWPTVDVGGYVSYYSPNYVVAPSEETTGFAKLKFCQMCKIGNFN